MPTQHVVIDEFKDISRPGSTWRLNWFGAVERDPNVATEYKLQIVLTLVKNTIHDDWHTEAAVDQNCLRMVLVGVGQLPLLRIGSLWKDGKLIRLRSGIEQVFTLDIPCDIPNFYCATDKIGAASLIPFRDHRIMGYGKNTKCIVLSNLDDDAGIIIPVIELIRFYYCRSTRLTKSVFDGDFVHAPFTIYDPNYTGKDKNIATVCRRQDVSDDDCWTIARILNSQAAFDGVRRVNDSMIRDFANIGQANPESIFPFSGTTSLKALCKKIGNAPSRWLVLSLISCSAPFPYDELQVIADNDGRSADTDTDVADQNKTPINRPLSNADEEVDAIRIQSANETDKSALPVHLELSGDCFTALLGKNIQKPSKDCCNYKSGQHRAYSGSQTELTGTSNGDQQKQNIGKVELVAPVRDSIPPSYELLIELVAELNTIAHVRARLYPLADGIGLVRVKRTAPAGRRQWAYLNSSTRRLRYLMMVEINYDDRFFYLVEVERRPNSSSDKYCADIFFNPAYSAISQVQTNCIVTELSRQNGRISKDETLTAAGIIISNPGLKHTWKNAKQYASRVINSLNCLCE